MGKDKFFFIDKKQNISVSYEKFIDDISKIKTLSNYLYEKNNYLFFLKLVASIFFERSVIVLDNDFSMDQLNRLGINFSEINKKNYVKSSLHLTLPLFVDRLKNVKNWTVTLYTSGTTGQPKKVTQTFSDITRTVKVSNDKKNDIWLLAYNPSHIAGLQVFFQALMNLNTIINVFNYSPIEIAKIIEEFQITNISATPTFYRLLLPTNKVFSNVKHITCGGEKLDGILLERLKKKFPNAKILNVYASTEAGTLFASDGEVFEVKNEYKNLVKIKNNELLLHESLLGKSNEIILKNGWYYTGDIVEIINYNPLKFRFTSRKNELINIGGYNVNPYEIEELLNSIPGIINSKVYAIKNSVLGNILAAEIVINKKNKIDELELREFLSERLQKFKVPRIFNFRNELSLTRTGKINRK